MRSRTALRALHDVEYCHGHICALVVLIIAVVAEKMVGTGNVINARPVLTGKLAGIAHGIAVGLTSTTASVFSSATSQFHAPSRSSDLRPVFCRYCSSPESDTQWPPQPCRRAQRRKGAHSAKAPKASEKYGPPSYSIDVCVVEPPKW